MNFLTFPVIRCSARNTWLYDNITIILLLICLKYNKGTGQQLIHQLVVKRFALCLSFGFLNTGISRKRKKEIMVKF